MAYSTEQRKKLMAKELPENRRAVAIVQAYLTRSGLTIADFARRINYSTIAVQKFLTGTYAEIAGSAANLISASMEFIDSHPVGASELEDQKLYETEDVRILRKYFYSALDHGRGYYCHGNPGSQKTFASKALIAELNRREISKNGHGRRAFRIYCREEIRPTSLMKRIALACGSSPMGDIDRILGNLRFDFRNRRALLIFDEAQHLNTPCLEVVRELMDEAPRFGLLFLGSHDLVRLFLGDPLKMEQWNGGRIRAGKPLPGLTPQEAEMIASEELQGKAKPEVLKKLIANSKADDFRKGPGHTYINARRLFTTLEEMNVGLAKKKEPEPAKQESVA